VARKLRQKLGEILVQEKIVPEAKVAEALQTAKSSGKRIGEVLIEMDACTEEDVARWVPSSACRS
jgi:MSHA biogenesis protein MshE